MKKFVSLILSLAICLSLVPSAFAVETVSADNKFTDVPANAWYLDDLNYAIANGYISGTGDNTFSPDAGFSRGQFVTILGRMLGASTADGTTKFTDVPTTSYYAPYVAWAAQNGYVNGTSDTNFSPDAVLTMEQMGTILANYISKTGVTLTGYTPSEAYKDASSISQWATASMETMRQYGLLVTDSSGNVNPTSQVTRASGAVSLVRLAKATGLGEAPTIIQPSTPQTPTQQTDSLYALFIPENPQFIAHHAYNDTQAAESNIRYMLKYGLTEARLTIDLNGRSQEAVTKDYYDTYLDVIDGYHGLVYALQFGKDKSSSDESAAILKLNAAVSNGEPYHTQAVQKAIQVHNDLWASGVITVNMTQKEKAKVYFDWLVKHCEYDWDGLEASENESDDDFFASIVDMLTSNTVVPSAYSALIEGISMCGGYTEAYNLLLRTENISCGSEIIPGYHMWSTATLDGVFYHIDATWGDMGNGSANQYFCMTPQASWARFK